MNMFSAIPVPPTQLGMALKEGRSVLINGDAETVLAELAGAATPVRVALIDPPYNRRTKFHHYEDSSSRPEWLTALRANCEQLHRALSVDGSLWMHIDDAEMFSAREMLDDVFGRRNFIATIVWQKTVSRDNRTAISTSHEYILVYARDKTSWLRARHKLPATAEQSARYKNPDCDPRGPWTSGDLTAKAGPGRRAAQFYDVATPSGRVVRPATGTCWRFTRERLDELIADGRIDFGGGDKMPRLKRFLCEVEPGLVPDTWWEGKVVGTADSAKRHLKMLFPQLVPFETPKPEELVSRILQIASDPGDLIVDCYGGSGTTAAVALKMGRQWLVCERERRTFQEFTLPRLQRVVDGTDLGGVSGVLNWAGGGDFVNLDQQTVGEIMHANSRRCLAPKRHRHRANARRQEMESLG
jgi:adenine-specific DNA-methyltransferase